MIKRILVPLDPSPYTESAIKYAGLFAKQQDAKISGLVVLDVPGIEKSIGATPAGGLYWAEKLEEHKIEQAKEKIEERLEKFKEICERENVKFNEAEEQGSPGARILQDSIFYDMIVMGQRTFYHFDASKKSGDSLEKILDHCITPILAVPESYKPIHNILIAFDGSLPAARALKRFAYLAAPNDFEIKLLMAETDLNTGNYYLDKAESYLNDYGIENVKKEWTPEEIIDVVDEKYMDWADLIVNGMHSRKGMLDFLVGSLPKHLIKEAKVPIFIGQ